VRLGPSTPGDYIRARVLVLRNPGVTMDVDMSAEERHLFSVGFKNTIGAKRASWKIISHEQKVAADRQTGVMIDAYKKKVEEELRKVCNEVLSVIAIHCLPLANTGENIVFFYKMYV
jgi:14-3-3 protein epsilon